jgi:hypothetical protein
MLGYQLIANPVYNADRGPVNVVSLRTRVAFGPPRVGDG